MTPENFSKHPALCPLPWTGIYINPDGRVKNCAISKKSLGNIHKEHLGDILNNDINKTIRKDMLDNVRHSRCDDCYRVEDNAQNKDENESNRTWYKKVALNNFTDLKIFDSVENFSPAVLDLRWRNTCNRACVYCGPDLSSMWEELTNYPCQIDEEVLNKSRDWIFSNLHSVKHVYLAGGEPLLIKENQYLLEKLLEIDPGVEIRINSNLGNINNPIFQLLSKFSNVKWTVSVDSKEDFFEYMRWPGKWDSLVENLLVLKGIVRDQINFNMVWCILNDIDLIETVDYLIDIGFHENMFIVQCLTDPSPLSLANLPKDHRKQLQEVILDRQKKCNPDWWLYKSLSSMYNFLNHEQIQTKMPEFQQQKTLSFGLQGTFEYLREIDEIQNKDSSKIFPRLYQYR